MSRLYVRVLLSFWAVMTIVVLGAVALTWVVLIERADEAGRAPAFLAREATQALDEGGEAGLTSWLSQVAAHQPAYHVYIIDALGNELLRRPLPPRVAWIAGRPPEPTRAEPRAEPPPPPLAARLLPPRPVPVLVSANGAEYRLIVLPHRGSTAPFELPWARAALLLLALAVTGIASLMLTRSVSQPVAALGRATRQLAGGDLRARVDSLVSRRSDELGLLARDFDAMAGRLEVMVDSKERLLQDISHELRSPLARMRVALGLARQDGGNVGVQLDRLEHETERLNGLIGQLLTLSRLGSDGVQLSVERLDLGDLIDGIARDAAFEGQARSVNVRWVPPATAIAIDGDAALLSSAIENVVRNALRYTPDSSSVGIEVRPAVGVSCVEIVIDDEGPGVPEAELEKIFAPFHRVAASRARDSGGDGLGLAITDRVLRAHHGAARAENRPNGGLRVILDLPVKPAEG